jgi:hypothetical protein
MSRLRIVLANSSLARYPQGGGHWSVRLQYLLGLRDLGHDVFLLETLSSGGDPTADEGLIGALFSRLRQYGLDDRCVVLLHKDGDRPLDFASATVHGRTRPEAEEILRGADLLWNDCCCLSQPMLSMFRRRVLIDLDPGHLQVALHYLQTRSPEAISWERSVYDHDAYLSVGRKLHAPDCDVPTLGVTWHAFTPFVYLPLWEVRPDPGARAPFSSVTHWTWGRELYWRDRALSTSKRDAYLRYIDLPRRASRPFELAAHIHPQDETGDHELLRGNGWRLVLPWEVAGSPSDYQRYIAGSRAEISCPKPVFRELNTGWFSDRSVCYLASGRPVLAEDTGFTDYLPAGKGLLAFRDMAGAVAGVTEIDSNYGQHARAARALAEEYFDSRRCLAAMLAACS